MGVRVIERTTKDDVLSPRHRERSEQLPYHHLRAQPQREQSPSHPSPTSGGSSCSSPTLSPSSPVVAPVSVAPPPSSSLGKVRRSSSPICTATVPSPWPRASMMPGGQRWRSRRTSPPPRA